MTEGDRQQTRPEPIERVAVIGAGLMGARIARLLAHCGITVRLYDQDAGARARAVVAAGTPSDPAGSLEDCASLTDAVRGVDLVIEAVSEDAVVKQALFVELDMFAPSTPIASNTSTFQPSELQAHLAVPERLLVTHFFNPADIVPLVEVVPSQVTDPGLVDRVRDLLVRVGKRPVVLRREAPGFVANRLQAAVLREALSLVSAGVVDVAEADEVVTASLGPRWAVVGPILGADLGGLDVFRALLTRLAPSLDDRTDPPEAVTSRVAAGLLGAKTGSGFYAHTEETTISIQSALADSYRRQRPALPLVAGAPTKN